eukprot:TRINITY_DN12046_c0_g1_i2.p1 TRINITY_DN12046_c0_g1~~TRINITY_DN12046_c0_g1_i2.p1  ORF type:complete len:217 (-),score=15.71 TRINITY_DN12046_c0_g1_i2:174-797(-)
MFLWRVAFLTACAADALADPSAVIKMAIDPIVTTMATKYNCSISVALRGSGPLRVTSAAGITDRATGREAQADDLYVWGSVTKLITGAGVLQLVDKGDIGLDDSVTTYIDPFLKMTAGSDPEQNYSSLEDLWGAEVHKITVRDLLGMTSGVPDYDTASPSGRAPTDYFRAEEERMGTQDRHLSGLLATQDRLKEVTGLSNASCRFQL